MQVMRQEIDLLLKLDNPIIIRPYEIYEDDKFIYSVMEYVDGMGLLDLMYQ